MSAASRSEIDATTAPRCGMTVTKPSVSSSRSDSRMVARETWSRSTSSRSTRRCPGRSSRSTMARRKSPETWSRSGAATRLIRAAVAQQGSSVMA